MGLKSLPLGNQNYVSEPAFAPHHIELDEGFVWVARLDCLGALLYNGGGARHHHQIKKNYLEKYKFLQYMNL